MDRKDRRRAGPWPRFDRLEPRTLLDAARWGLPSWARPDPARSLLGHFVADAPEARARAAQRGVGGQIEETHPDGADVVAFPSGADRTVGLGRLRRKPRVLFTEPDETIRASAFVPNDPSFGSQYGLNNPNDVDLDAPQAWEVSTGSGTIVAVLDTGIDTTHPDLASRLWVNPGEIPGNGRDDDRDGFVDDVNGWNFAEGTNDIRDDNGHGSHVSGIVAAAGNNGVGVIGVAWNARILPLKILDSQGNGSQNAAVAAIYYAVAHGARVINASWGGAGSSQAMANAIQYAGAHGVVFVTAAGNETANNDVVRTYPAGYRFSNVISVAAVDSAGNLARFSNHGPATVDVAGPGVGILSTVPGGYASYSGTSMATPYVSGVVALLAAQHPEYTAAQLVRRVVETTKPLTGRAGLTASRGLVDAAGALGLPVAGTSVRRAAVQRLFAPKVVRRRRLAPRAAPAAPGVTPRILAPRPRGAGARRLEFFSDQGPGRAV